MRSFNTVVLLLLTLTVAEPVFASGPDYARVEDVNNCYNMSRTPDQRVEDCTRILEAAFVRGREVYNAELDALHPSLGVDFYSARMPCGRHF